MLEFLSHAYSFVLLTPNQCVSRQLCAEMENAMQTATLPPSPLFEYCTATAAGRRLSVAGPGTHPCLPLSGTKYSPGENDTGR
ncbi:hypothetical protein PoB_007715600 [Plakobranchus ocellatus]|uniref:Uncharacterized protein n=1 Tax=Plakobranchus ocellatus TaxID=259542 RepID=A0AAV4E4L2_9GAST|nr:hypothetical protein PoB_007715600 [Plakobranchus ocellatus]